MHTIISYAVLIFLGIKSANCDVLVYESPSNRVSFFACVKADYDKFCITTPRRLFASLVFFLLFVKNVFKEIIILLLDI